MIIQCDFDGTIIMQNLSIMLRERFARFDWGKLERDYTEGRLTVEQSNVLQYSMIRGPEAEMLTFVRDNYEVRPGFAELISFCRDNGVRFVIVSSGLDFYIHAVLEGLGMGQLERYCAATRFTEDGIHVTYTAPDGTEIEDGFKESYLSWFRESGVSVTYIGDGLSDLKAAAMADHVFAVGGLPALLDGQAVPYHRFTDFHEVLRKLRALVQL